MLITASVTIKRRSPLLVRNYWKKATSLQNTLTPAWNVKKGIAIPHADYTLVNVNSISIVRFANDVTFGQMEDADLTVDCSIMFNLAFATSDQHMSILRRLFTLFQDNAFVETCRNLPATRVAKYVEDTLAAS